MPMQPDLTDEQALFRDTAVSFIEAELPVAGTRELHDDPLGYDRSWLRKSAELGWFAMLVPEACWTRRLSPSRWAASSSPGRSSR
jgi:alkylation response protein AidB-like acyl-CoA dehydrogenase